MQDVYGGEEHMLWHLEDIDSIVSTETEGKTCRRQTSSSPIAKEIMTTCSRTLIYEQIPYLPCMHPRFGLMAFSSWKFLALPQECKAIKCQARCCKQGGVTPECTFPFLTCPAGELNKVKKSAVCVCGGVEHR